MSYIYVAESGDGYVKIGASKYPEDRIKQIESSTGVSITRWESFKCESNHFDIEKLIHEEICEKSLFGEWFSINFDDALSVCASRSKEKTETSNEPKQRAVYFTDDEWERVKNAAKNSPQRNTTHFVSEVVMKAVKRSEK